MLRLSIRSRLSGLLLGFFLALPAWGEFQVPPLQGPVMDMAQMLSPQTEQGMDRLLRALHSQGGTQLQVLTVENLGGLSIEEASIKVTDQWKLGSAKSDNGVLLLLARDERRVRIEVGQGREGDLPDVVASRIIREVIVPQMRQGGADRALTAGVFAILHYTDPEFLEKSGVRAAAPNAGVAGGLGRKLELFLFLFFGVIFFINAIFFRRRRGLWNVLDGGGHRGGFGGGGFGGGFGGGGGGWSGGGGGFSGGGASGGW